MTDHNENKKVRWGILSTASVSSKLAAALTHQDSIRSSLVAIASRNLEKSKQFAGKWKVARYYGTYEELINDQEIDVVYIPLPTSMKEEWAIKAANKKKHILVEKPLLDAPSTIRIIEACQKNGVQFLDGTMWRHHTRTEEVWKLLHQDKAIGDLKRATASISMNLTDTGNIRWNKELEPSGALGDLGWYAIFGILWAFNFEMPSKVWASIRYKLDVPMALDAVLWFSNDKMANFCCSFEEARRQYLEITGTNLVVTIENFVRCTTPYLNAEEAIYHITDHQGKSTDKKVLNCSHAQRMVEALSQIALDNKINQQWMEEALKVMKVSDALLKSNEQVIAL